MQSKLRKNAWEYIDHSKNHVTYIAVTWLPPGHVACHGWQVNQCYNICAALNRPCRGNAGYNSSSYTPCQPLINFFPNSLVLLERWAALDLVLLSLTSSLHAIYIYIYIPKLMLHLFVYVAYLLVFLPPPLSLSPLLISAIPLLTYNTSTNVIIRCPEATAYIWAERNARI